MKMYRLVEIFIFENFFENENENSETLKAN